MLARHSMASDHDDGPRRPVPLVILTGFLGAGKTTTLNRVLGAPPRLRLAVVVNELGRIDIDGKLLRARAGDMVELAGGCVCHEVRTLEELAEGLRELYARSRPERIVLETTGIAEPQPLLEGLARVTDLVSASAVVTVVDAEAGAEQLERFPEARAQAAMADRILLTKLDRAPAGALAAVHRALDQLNPAAERAVFPAGEAAAVALAAWLLDRPGGRRRRGLHHHGDHQLVAAAFSDEAPLLSEPLLGLCERLGPALVRVKGFVHLAGEDRRAFLERAGRATSLRLGEPWPAGPRRSELVFIVELGQGLDPAAVERELLACRGGAR
jgi:G3E family GTPase